MYAQYLFIVLFYDCYFLQFVLWYCTVPRASKYFTGHSRYESIIKETEDNVCDQAYLLHCEIHVIKPINTLWNFCDRANYYIVKHLWSSHMWNVCDQSTLQSHTPCVVPVIIPKMPCVGLSLDIYLSGAGYVIKRQIPCVTSVIKPEVPCLVSPSKPCRYLFNACSQATKDSYLVRCTAFVTKPRKGTVWSVCDQAKDGRLVQWLWPSRRYYNFLSCAVSVIKPKRDTLCSVCD